MKLLFIILLTVTGLWAKPIFTNTDQLSTSKYINSLKDLLVATQKTRGMTYTYLKGDSSIIFKVFDYHKEMKDALLQLEIIDLGADNAIANRQLRLENILVLANLAQIQSAENLNPLGKLSVENLLKTALPLTEKIGQLRAYGSGGIAVIQSGKEVHPLEIHKITILLKEIEQELRQFEIGAIAVSSHYSSQMDSELKIALNRNRDDIDTFKELTKTIFVKNKKTDTSPVQYFAYATKTIDDLLYIFELQNRAIKESSKGWI
jgi:hypothetical protein